MWWDLVAVHTNDRLGTSRFQEHSIHMYTKISLRLKEDHPVATYVAHIKSPHLCSAVPLVCIWRLTRLSACLKTKGQHLARLNGLCEAARTSRLHPPMRWLRLRTRSSWAHSMIFQSFISKIVLSPLWDNAEPTILPLSERTFVSINRSTDVALRCRTTSPYHGRVISTGAQPSVVAECWSWRIWNASYLVHRLPFMRAGSNIDRKTPQSNRPLLFFHLLHIALHEMISPISPSPSLPFYHYAFVYYAIAQALLPRLWWTHCWRHQPAHTGAAIIKRRDSKYYIHNYTQWDSPCQVFAAKSASPILHFSNGYCLEYSIVLEGPTFELQYTEFEREENHTSALRGVWYRIFDKTFSSFGERKKRLIETDFSRANALSFHSRPLGYSNLFWVIKRWWQCLLTRLVTKTALSYRQFFFL